MSDWFAKVPPRVANSIAPVHQDKPPLWGVIAFALLVILCLSPFFYVVAAILGVVP